MVDAHSELMAQYPWGFAGTCPNASDNAAGHGGVRRRQRSCSATRARCRPSRARTTTRRSSARTATPVGGRRRAPATAGRTAPAAAARRRDQTPAPMPSECDDGPFGRGTGGRLRYTVTRARRRLGTVWLAVAGSDELGSPRRAASSRRADATRPPSSPQKIARREALARRSRLSLPGDPLLQESIDWGKQNLADLTQTAEDLRDPLDRPGQAVPAAGGHVPRPAGSAPASRTTRGCSAPTASTRRSRASALGQFEPIKDHLRALRDISEILNDGSGVVVHEVVADGSIWYGKDLAAPTRDGRDEVRLQHGRDRQVPERRGADLALDGRRRRSATRCYDFSVRNLATCGPARRRRRRLAGGQRQRRAPGMGEEKLDNAVYSSAGSTTRRHGALRPDRRRARAGARTRRRARAQLRGRRGGSRRTQQYADSLDDPGGERRSTRSTGSASTRWRPSCNVDGEFVPGLAPFAHGTRALAERESHCYSGERPGNRGLFHTGCGGGPEGKGESRSSRSDTGIQAIGEGNYGRLGAGQQQRYTDAAAETQFAQPATGGTPDEQPGAMPEIFPSSPPDGTAARANIDRCWTCRSMFMQAWGHYGTAWAAVHQQLGVRPDLGRGLLEVVPQVPGRPAERGGRRHPPRQRLGRRVRRPRRAHLHDDARHERAPIADVPHRPHAAARRDGRVACCSTARLATSRRARPTAGSR